jgi:hypothetical protein
VFQAVSCSIDLTSAGLASDHWRGVFQYRATADSEGHVSRLNPVRFGSSEAMAPLVRLDQLESCMTRWVFSGAGEYSIQFAVGTGGDAIRQWSVTVASVPTSLEAMRAVLSRGRPRQFRLVLPRAQ